MFAMMGRIKALMEGEKHRLPTFANLLSLVGLSGPDNTHKLGSGAPPGRESSTCPLPAS